MEYINYYLKYSNTFFFVLHIFQFLSMHCLINQSVSHYFVPVTYNTDIEIQHELPLTSDTSHPYWYIHIYRTASLCQYSVHVVPFDTALSVSCAITRFTSMAALSSLCIFHNHPSTWDYVWHTLCYSSSCSVLYMYVHICIYIHIYISTGTQRCVPRPLPLYSGQSPQLPHSRIDTSPWAIMLPLSSTYTYMKSLFPRNGTTVAPRKPRISSMLVL